MLNKKSIFEIEDNKNKNKNNNVTVEYSDCNYCCTNVSQRDYILHDSYRGVFIDEFNNLDNDLEFWLLQEQIKYCPMCGRKL